MSGVDRAGGEPGPARRWRSAFITAIVFGLFGPMIGGSVFILGVAAFLSFVTAPGEGWSGMVGTAFSMPWIWIPKTILPAALVGLTIGLLDQFVGRTSFAIAAAIGCFAGVAWSIAGFGAQSDLDGVMAGLVAIGAGIASGLCWRLTRWTARR